MIAIFFKFPNISHPLHDTDFLKSITCDKYGISIEVDDNQSENEVKLLFESIGAKNITAIYWDNDEVTFKNTDVVLGNDALTADSFVVYQNNDASMLTISNTLNKDVISLDLYDVTGKKVVNRTQLGKAEQIEVDAANTLEETKKHIALAKKEAGNIINEGHKVVAEMKNILLSVDSLENFVMKQVTVLHHLYNPRD